MSFSLLHFTFIYVLCKKYYTRFFFFLQIKPLYQEYQKILGSELWEPLNRFWAECYESCKLTSQKRAHIQMESRKRFQVKNLLKFHTNHFYGNLFFNYIQERILNSYRIRQSEESARINVKNSCIKTKTREVELKWKMIGQYLYGIRGPWAKFE